MLATPVLILELNVARVEGRLGEDDSSQKFAAFVRSLTDDAVRADVLCEYVVLTRLVTQRLMFWIDRRMEMLEAFLEDLPQLSQQLWDGRVPTVTEVRCDAGDSHRQGRSVAIVNTTCGPVVFKPRDVALDRAFDGLLAWANKQLVECPLGRMITVGGADRTWMQFVDTSVATDEAGADRYARRLGRLTALLYVLHSTDFHFENVMASGEHPILVDLEALLHVDPMGSTPGQDDGIVNAAATVLGESIRSIGIIPDRILVKQNNTSFAVDVSAIGGHGGQEGLVEVPTVVDAGRDTMHIDALRHIVPAQANMPTSEAGGPLELISRDRPFIEGFTEMYDAMRLRSEELVSSDGPLAAFERSEVRHIARPTFQYGRLLLKSMHPDFQRDALDYLMYLGKLLGGHAGRPDRVGVIAAEVEDLLVGDIPIFSVDVASGDLLAGSAHVPLGRRAASPLTIARERARNLSSDDLSLQTRIAEYSFVAASIDGEVDKWPGWTAPRRQSSEGARDEIRSAAVDLAHDLMDRAVQRQGHVGWIGLNLVDERWWTLSPTSMDLYSGIPGIALALASVGKVTGDAEVLDFGQRTFDQVAQQAGVMAELAAGQDAKRGATGMDAGAFGILGGTMYALAYGARLCERADWGRAAARLIPTLSKVVDIDDNCDIVSGSAGALLVGLAVDDFASGEGLELAGRAAQRLRETARRDGEDCSWVSPVADGQALVGFSHGTLGIAFALSALAARQQRPDFVELIDGALHYETRHFNAETGDSSDLRSLAGARGWDMRAWCHGAGGGALGRAALLRHPHVLSDPDTVAVQRDLAVQALWATGLGDDVSVHGIGNHCLCHGDVGNMVAASLSSSSLDAEREAGTWGALVTAGRDAGWLCGVPRGVYTPGLMTGTAGIAWGLAQAYSDYRLPNLLLVDTDVPPRATP